MGWAGQAFSSISGIWTTLPLVRYDWYVDAREERHSDSEQISLFGRPYDLQRFSLEAPAFCVLQF